MEPVCGSDQVIFTKNKPHLSSYLQQHSPIRQPLYANAPPKPKRVSASSRDHSPEIMTNEFNASGGGNGGGAAMMAASPPQNQFHSPQRMAYPHQGRLMSLVAFNFIII